jgi:hypothetical protein
VNEHAYLIVAGTTKAGTTSLFIYLQAHPEVCASNVKETRFFLDPNYPLPAKYRLEDGLERYDAYFNHCQVGRLRVEATPDYLYSAGTPLRIQKSLSRVKLVFILRDPVERLVSWYRFARQNNLLPAQIDFDEYVRLQIESEGAAGPVEQHLRALEQGRYSIYLAPYFDLFPPEALRILRLVDLKHEPSPLMVELCAWTGLAPSFFADYDFRVFNPTQTMKSARLNASYRHIREMLRLRVHDRPRLHRLLRTLRRRFEPALLRLNQRPDEQVHISAATRSLLDAYYRDEPAALASLLGREPFAWQ